MKAIRGGFRAAVLMGAAASVLVIRNWRNGATQNNNGNGMATAIPIPTAIRGLTHRRANRPYWRWLAT